MGHYKALHLAHLEEAEEARRAEEALEERAAAESILTIVGEAVKALELQLAELDAEQAEDYRLYLEMDPAARMRVYPEADRRRRDRSVRIAQTKERLAESRADYYLKLAAVYRWDRQRDNWEVPDDLPLERGADLPTSLDD